MDVEKFLKQLSVAQAYALLEKAMRHAASLPEPEWSQTEGAWKTATEKGLVNGLAWTSVGGELLEVEVNVVPGSGKVELTGNLGDVMKESAQAETVKAEKVGKKRSTVSNYMRLLKLPNEVQLALKEGLISMGHAKAIAGAPEELQLRLLKKCIRKGLSVRQIEELVRALTDPAAKPAAPAEDEEYPESYARLVEQLEKFFSQEISIKRSKNGGGRIVIDFSDDRDIDRFIEKFEKRGASAEIRNNK